MIKLKRMSEELIEYNVRFKDIEGYVGIYQITDDGRVFNKKTEKFLKSRINNNIGYLQVNLCKKGVIKTHTIHKLIAGAFLENPDNKKCVDHINTNKTDNNIDNLRWVTYSENQMNIKMKKNKSTQIKGVYKNRNNFQAEIKKNGISISKTFKTLEEASLWRRQKEQEVYGEFAYKN